MSSRMRKEAAEFILAGGGSGDDGGGDDDLPPQQLGLSKREVPRSNKGLVRARASSCTSDRNGLLRLRLSNTNHPWAIPLRS
jgi:hypothetical protein